METNIPGDLDCLLQTVGRFGMLIDILVWYWKAGHVGTLVVPLIIGLDYGVFCRMLISPRKLFRFRGHVSRDGHRRGCSAPFNATSSTAVPVASRAVFADVISKDAGVLSYAGK